jgi:predicted nucleic acid-binding protein
MGRLADVTERYGFVGLDTVPFIYQFETHGTFTTAAHDLFDGLSASRYSACTSVLTLCEIVARPLRYGLERTTERYRMLISEMPNVRLIDIDASIAMEAPRLRATYRLEVPDALHVASCLAAGASAFVTNDRQLKRIREIPVLLLSDFLED